MDIQMNIASASINMASTRIMKDVNTALLGKVLDTAQMQGEAITKMLDQVSTQRLLDTYA